jgi:hypothetical protein
LMGKRFDKTYPHFPLQLCTALNQNLELIFDVIYPRD